MQTPSEPIRTLAYGVHWHSLFSDAGRLILRYLRPLRWRLAELTLLAVFVSALDAAAMVLILAFVHVLVGSGSAPGQASILGFGYTLPLSDRLVLPALVGVFVAKELLESVRRHVAITAQRDFVERLRKDTMLHLLSMPLRYFNEEQSGSSAYLVNSQVSRFSAFLPLASDATVTVITLVLFVGMLAALQPLWTSLVVSVVAVVWLCLRHHHMRLLTLGLLIARKSTAAAAMVQDAIRGIKLVKVCRTEAAEADRACRAAMEVADLQVEAQAVKNTMRVSMNIWLLAAVVGMSLVASRTSGAGTSSVFLGYLMLLLRCVPLASRLSEMKLNLSAMWGHAVQVGEFHRQATPPPTDISVQAADECAAVEVQGVGFFYSPSQPVLENVWLTLAEGRAVALVGLTGSGKTTLLDILAGLREPRSGRIILHTRGGSPGFPTGYVTQDPILMYGTVGENVRYGAPVGIARDFPHLRVAPGRLVGEGGSQLSGGQRQLVALARLGWRGGTLWLLDEPTASMDAQTERQVIQWLLAQRAGRIIVVATHRLAAIRDVDWIYVLHNGRIIQEGTHHQLAARDGLYQRLWRLQEVGD